MILEAAKDNPFTRDLLLKVEDQTRKIISMVRQLMDVSKFEHGVVSYNHEQIEINAFFDHIKEGIRFLAPKHSLQMNIGVRGGVLADVIRLEQVITNLVNNAAKYSNAGTEILLEASVNCDTLLIRVTDNGMGMSTETQEKIFQKFFREKQVEKKYSGLGMGLYIVNRIVKDHKGNIEVESAPGKGSVFSVSLPLYVA